MNKYLTPLLIVAALYFGWSQFNEAHDDRVSSARIETGAASGNDPVAAAFRDQRSGLQVAGDGVVDRVLSDDNDGGRHQRFILRLASGQTVLVAHNIDLAPRIAQLERGDTVAFSGMYEWNDRGGVVHWTHHDPSGQHQAGWLKHNGSTYQ